MADKPLEVEGGGQQFIPQGINPIFDMGQNYAGTLKPMIKAGGMYGGENIEGSLALMNANPYRQKLMDPRTAQIQALAKYKFNNGMSLAAGGDYTPGNKWVDPRYNAKATLGYEF